MLGPSLCTGWTWSASQADGWLHREHRDAQRDTVGALAPVSLSRRPLETNNKRGASSSCREFKEIHRGAADYRNRCSEPCGLVAAHVCAGYPLARQDRTLVPLPSSLTVLLKHHVPSVRPLFALSHTLCLSSSASTSTVRSVLTCFDRSAGDPRAEHCWGGSCVGRVHPCQRSQTLPLRTIAIAAGAMFC